MNRIWLLSCLLLSWLGQAQEQQLDLGRFNMSNASTPAFLMVEASPTTIYTPDNLKSLVLHALNNFGKSAAVEMTPYFFIKEINKNRTYNSFIGVTKDENGKIKQNPFAGWNTTTFSFAYVDKKFNGMATNRKAFALGGRTTLIRLYNKNKVYNNYLAMSNALAKISPPMAVLTAGEEAIKAYYKTHYSEALTPYLKAIKPIFRLDGALGYSTLFKENDIDSGTASRFGCWLTAEFSLLLNGKSTTAKHNNYVNVLALGRYVLEDGYNMNAAMQFNTQYYRDWGLKSSIDLGRFSLSYEYIVRNGDLKQERSVGTLGFILTKDVSISGGFGKDFPSNDNLITLLGLHWGLNFGTNNVTLTDK